MLILKQNYPNEARNVGNQPLKEETYKLILLQLFYLFLGLNLSIIGKNKILL